MGKRVFIVGAGFSKAAGMPLATELTEPVIRRGTYFEAGSSDPNEAYDWLTSFGRRLYGATGRQLSIEEVFHYARFDIEALRLHEQIERDSDISQDAEGWLNYLQDAVIDEIWDLQKNALSNEGFDSIKRWAQAVSPDDTIVVFNYDQLVEKSLASSGKSWVHGFEGEKSAGIPVLKLHGSIDWLISRCIDSPHPLCQSNNCTVLFQREYADNSPPEAEISKYFVHGLRRNRVVESLLRVNQYELLDMNINPALLGAHEEKRPGIAALGAYKPLSEIPSLGVVWRKACLALHEADEVVSIGFSFADFDATAALQFGGVHEQRVKRGDPLPQLTVIDPNAHDISNRAQSIFQPREHREFAHCHEHMDWSSI